jgi:predicted nucleotidyltransferase component of viral defense system
LIEVQQIFGLPERAQVEKDWFVVKALGAITAADAGPLKLVFQGGTSLSRAHRIIERMSEDIDIKIIEDKKHPRSVFRRLRTNIIAELQKAGFSVNPSDETQVKVLHASTYTLLRLPYEPIAKGRGALRPEIQVEISLWPLRRPAIELPVSSFIAEAFGRPAEVPVFACSAIVETAAEKFVAVTRRAGAELAGVHRTHDPTLVRHVYDLHAIRTHYDRDEVAALAREVMQADAETRGHEFPAYGADPLAETLRAVAGIEASAEYAGDYAVLQRDLVYGPKAEFKEAIATLKALAERAQMAQT